MFKHSYGMVRIILRYALFSLMYAWYYETFIYSNRIPLLYLFIYFIMKQLFIVIEIHSFIYSSIKLIFIHCLLLPYTELFLGMWYIVISGSFTLESINFFEKKDHFLYYVFLVPQSLSARSGQQQWKYFIPLTSWFCF